MDDAYVRAVMRFFVHLWEQGLDLPREPDRQLVPVPPDVALRPRGRARRGRRRAHLRPLPVRRAATVDVTIATVRPATILADVAVAVHPDDERYRDLVGREVVVPCVERRVPVIADERVEIDFGTGALKITPGHDPKDYEIGRDHDAARADGDRAGRADERGGRRARGPHAGRGGRADPRLAARARPAREARVVPAHGRALRPLQDADRAARSRCSGGARWTS